MFSLVSYQLEVMANRPHQSLVYRITDASTLLVLGSCTDHYGRSSITYRSLSCTADGSSVPGGALRGEGEGSNLVIFWRGAGGLTVRNQNNAFRNHSRISS